MAAQQITEESGVHKAWYEEARNVTRETLPEFVRRLTEDYEHDYGTICHAIAAAAIASHAFNTLRAAEVYAETVAKSGLDVTITPRSGQWVAVIRGQAPAAAGTGR